MNKWKTFNITLYKKFLQIVGFTNDKTSRNLFRLFQIAFYAVVVVFVVNLFSLLNKDTNYGTWGDFFGGVLNPILTFLTFMGLLITIILQQTELKQSRKEFQGQKEALENQEFDNKFFQMLNLLNNIIPNLEINSHTRGKKVFHELLNKFVESFKITNPNNLIIPPTHNKENYQAEFKKYNNTYDSSFKYYFLNLYQILNYIEKNSTDEYSLKEYANIVRAQLSKNELILLFFNAIGVIKFSGNKYKLIIEKYAFFEHLTYDDLTKYDKNNKDTCMYHLKDLVNLILPMYDEKAFGNNKELLTKIKELKKDNKTLERNI